jgi:methyl-accepting chemotaxis protein
LLPHLRNVVINFDQYTIGKRLFICSATLLAFLVVLGGISLYELADIIANVKSLLTDSLPGTEHASEIGNLMREVRGNLWRHIGIPSASEKLEMEARNRKAEARLHELVPKYEATIQTAEDRALFTRLIPAFEKFASALPPIATLSREGKVTEAGELYQKQTPLWTEIAEMATKLEQMNKASSDVSARALQASATRAKSWVWGVLLVAILFGLGITILVSRSANTALRTAAEELSTASEQVATAASQVASASQSLAQGSSEQAAAVEQTSATSQEVTSMARQNAENSQQASSMMNTSQETAEKVKTAVTELSASMQKIDSSSGKISAIIRVIDEIAFQTNILALNAAVEAARAGDAGMGFAVVADEVRNLAQRSAQAAKDTAGLIEGAVADTSKGSLKVQEVVEAMKQNAEIGIRVTALVDQITAASREQATGVEQISRAMSHIEQATQKAAASAEQSAAASQELTAQADAMRRVVQHMRALSGVGHS